MPTTILERFQDGRLLVEQTTQLGAVNAGVSGYVTSTSVRVGSVRQILSILQIGTDKSLQGVVLDPEECIISGDTIYPIIRRGDAEGWGVSGVVPASGYPVAANGSGIFASGVPYLGQLISCYSGQITIKAKVIAI